MSDTRECLRASYDAANCRGEVTGRQATTCTVYECEHHMSESQERIRETEERYGLNSSPGIVPSWYDYSNAGEYYDEDY